MAERSRPTRRSGASEEGEVRTADETERLLGRTLAFGLPAASLVGAVIVGFVASFGSALLVAAAGALLGTIALLWASLRTLSGDAPLPSGFDALTQREGVDALAEHKRRALRALKDLESERALGRIDDADYEAFQHRYREEAKELMRRIDARAAPSRADAERIARDYIARHRRGTKDDGEEKRVAPALEDTAKPGPTSKRAERVACGACGASNESDATFCKQCGLGIERSTDATDARA